MDLKEKYAIINPYLDEHTRRIWAATEALALGNDGPVLVAEATNMSLSTVYIGLKELKNKTIQPVDKTDELNHRYIRKAGGGRKKIIDMQPKILEELEFLVDETTRGDPDSPLKWTCKSTTNIAEELQKLGYHVSQRTVCDLLNKLGYSLQSNRKTKEGKNSPDRDAQFKYISKIVQDFQAKQLPVISVDTKKKELIGNFKNEGKEWHHKNSPVQVKMHDFIDKSDGKAIPYGVYDISKNKGCVNIGFDHDTAKFAVESIRRWWNEVGRVAYPQAKRILITADGGGSNGHRVKLWKVELQKLANELSMTIQVCHFPPGTSKWNKIEHRMFCHISKNWRGKPLISREVIVNLISNTRTKQGLEIKAMLDEGKYPTGTKINKKTLNELSIEKDEFHGDWNYQIKPKII